MTKDFEKNIGISRSELYAQYAKYLAEGITLSAVAAGVVFLPWCGACDGQQGWGQAQATKDSQQAFNKR